MMRQLFIRRLRKDKGFTLVEALLAVGILAMIITAMTPFIRTIYNSWNFGDRKTEIQQNARVGMEMMTRILRQAKRITAIPASGSGNFVEFRNALDNTTTVFFHNIAASPYYLDDTGLIKINDLVMRTIPDSGSMTNALLARSLGAFNINFKDGSGDITAKASEARYLDINISLSDPQGLILATLDLFSSIALRSDAKLSIKPVWVAAGNCIVEVSTNTFIPGFSKPQSVAVDYVSGECWVADTGNNRVVKISPTGQILLNLKDFKSPAGVAVNQSTHECWVADTGNNRIKKYSSGGVKLAEKLLGTGNPWSPTSITVSSSSSSSLGWVTLKTQITKFSGVDGTLLLNVASMKSPASASINSSGNATWIADTGNNRIKKYTTRLEFSLSGFKGPSSVSVNSNTGECWVADKDNNLVKKISSSGAVLLSKTGFNKPAAVSVDSADNSCWIADYGSGEIVNLDSQGNEIARVGGIASPCAISVKSQ